MGSKAWASFHALVTLVRRTIYLVCPCSVSSFHVILKYIHIHLVYVFYNEFVYFCICILHVFICYLRNNTRRIGVFSRSYLKLAMNGAFVAWSLANNVNLLVIVMEADIRICSTSVTCPGTCGLLPFPVLRDNA